MPESIGSDVPAVEEVRVRIHSPEGQGNNSERREHVNVPGRLRYPSRLLSSAGKDNSENQ
jgi:hypothetical protein